MDARHLFLDQHTFVRRIVDVFVFGGLEEDQLRRHPNDGQSSLAWLLWHAARWEDIVVNTWIAERPQVLDAGNWLSRMRLARREVGTALPPDDREALSDRVALGGLYGYWNAVADRTREVVQALATDELDDIVDDVRRARATTDGACGNPRAPWLDQFFAGRSKAWFLAYLNVHNAEHLIGEARSVRGQIGDPIGQ